MDVNLTRQTLEAEKTLGAEEAQVLLRAETLVSGAGREEVEILMSDAAAVLDTVDVQAGRVLVEGKVKCEAAYRLGSENVVRALNAETALNHAFDMKDVAAGGIVRARVHVDDVRARYENGHMLFDVSVTVNAQAAQLNSVEALTGIEDAPDIEAKYEDIVSVKLNAENTASALLSGSVALPAQLDARMALMEWATPTDIDARRDVGGVRVTGSLLVETLISGGTASRPAALIRYALPIDQLIEMPDWLAGNTRATVAVRALSTEVEQAPGGEDSLLRMEAEAAITVSALGEDRVRALTDAYGTGKSSVAVENQDVELLSGVQHLDVSEPFRGTLLMPEGAGAVKSVCAVRARATVGEIVPGRERTTISGVVDAQVLYISGSTDKPARAAAELPFEVSLAAELSEDAPVEIHVLSAEGNALMSDRVEFKCMLNIQAEKCDRQTISIAANVAYGEETDPTRGVLIVWPQADETTWTLGKKYGMKLDRIREANGGAEVLEPGRALVMRI